MRQCELEKISADKETKKMKRTGTKMVTFLDRIDSSMEGSIIDLKKVKGLWVVDKVHEMEIEAHQIKRHWHVGGL